MTIAVSITSRPLQNSDGSSVVPVLHVIENKKKSVLHRFSNEDHTWEGHIWQGRELHIEEEIVKASEPKEAKED